MGRYTSATPTRHPEHNQRPHQSTTVQQQGPELTRQTSSVTCRCSQAQRCWKRLQQRLHQTARYEALQASYGSLAGRKAQHTRNLTVPQSTGDEAASDVATAAASPQSTEAKRQSAPSIPEQCRCRFLAKAGCGSPPEFKRQSNSKLTLTAAACQDSNASQTNSITDTNRSYS